MNGRVYDYRLGRFLSVDSIISNPANSQSLNAYSYVGNNPLSGVDPTGYSCVEVTGSHVCQPANDANKAVGAYLGMGTRIQWVNAPTSSGANGLTAAVATSTASQHGGPTETATANTTGPDQTGSKDGSANQVPMPGSSTTVNGKIFEPRSWTDREGIMHVSGTWHPTPDEWAQATVTELNVFFGFVSGRGPRNLYFGPNAPETWVLRTSRGYRGAWSDYQTQRKLDSINGVPPHAVSIGVPGETDFMKGSVLTTVMGTYSVTFEPIGNEADVIRVNAYNNTSLTSGGHGFGFRGQDQLQQIEGDSPLSSVRQYFQWFESMPYTGISIPAIPANK